MSSPKEQTVFFPGKFNPPHLGHIKTILKLASKYKFVYIGVSGDVPKNSLMTQLEITRELDDIFQGFNNISVWPFNGVLINKENAEGLPKVDLLLSGNLEVINWAQSMGIDAEFVDRSEGILCDSSEIRDKLAKGDPSFIQENVKLMRISGLLTYEKYNRVKVDRLKLEIQSSGYFVNPITVTKQEKIVIDGANRLQALKELGMLYIPCLLVDYDDVKLVANEHYLDFDGSLSFAPGVNVSFGVDLPPEERAANCNIIVEAYQGRPYTRLSEGHRKGTPTIGFPKFEKHEIIYFANNNIELESGITWHQVPTSVISLKVPVSVLSGNFDIACDVFDIVVEQNKGNVRYYNNAVYTCNEYDTGV